MSNALLERIKAEPFFPDHDGPTNGNAAAFRDYQRRIVAIVEEGTKQGLPCIRRVRARQMVCDIHGDTKYCPSPYQYGERTG